MMSLGSFDAFPEVMIGFLLRNKFLMSQNKISAKPLLANDEEGHQERHIDAGEYLKSLVFGGLDGCINTLLIILSGVSSGTKPYEIFILCLCAIVGDGIGMGLGDYLSALAEIKYIKSVVVTNNVMKLFDMTRKSIAGTNIFPVWTNDAHNKYL